MGDARGASRGSCLACGSAAGLETVDPLPLEPQLRLSLGAALSNRKATIVAVAARRGTGGKERPVTRAMDDRVAWHIHPPRAVMRARARRCSHALQRGAELSMRWATQPRATR